MDSNVVGVNATITSMAWWDPDGPGPLTAQLVAGGLFVTEGCRGVGVRDDISGFWNPLGTGIFGNSLAGVYCVAGGPDGVLYIGGRFEGAGSLITANIARWVGGAWTYLDGGIQGQVYALLVLPDGGLLAGGTFGTAGPYTARGLARWDGARWWPVGDWSGNVRALATLGSGEIIAGGVTNDGPSQPLIRAWNGASWQELGGGISGVQGRVEAMAVLPSGELVAGGFFESAGGVAANSVARWDGLQWYAMGSGVQGTVLALRVMADGSLLVGGLFETAGGVVCHNVVRWQAEAWHAVGAGTDGGVQDIVDLGHGRAAVGGQFAFAGGVPRDRFAVVRRLNADFDQDGDTGTDADIEAFFACLAGTCCSTCDGADFDGDGNPATNADIESFFRVLAGGLC